MTSQVCLVNPRGVALASDSLVSFGYSGSRGYPTVNKIFSLSGRQPIGIMISGSAICPTSDLPWERIIGKYREKVGTREMVFQDYVNEFQNVMMEHYDKVANDETIRSDLIKHFSERVFHSTNEREKMKGVLYRVEEEIPEVKVHFEALVHEQIASIHSKSKEGLDVFTRFEETGKSVDEPLYRWYKTIEEYNSENALEAAKIFCQRHEIEIHQQEVSEIFLYHLVKFGADPKWKTQTQIVFAGFAENDVRPFNASFTATCLVGEGSLVDWEGHILRPYTLMDTGGLVREEEMDWDVFSPVHPEISKDNSRMKMWSASAFILPYAIRNEIWNIVSGIHPHVRDGLSYDLPFFLADEITEDFKKILAELIEDGNLRDSIEEEILQRKPEFVEKLSGAMTSHLGYYTRVERFRSSVHALPMEELCDLAKFLINSESSIMNWTTDHNYVGGPVDVASITREDGFMWVETKQRFDPGKNPRQIDIDRPSSNFR